MGCSGFRVCCVQSLGFGVEGVEGSGAEGFGLLDWGMIGALAANLPAKTKASFN